MNGPIVASAPISWPKYLYWRALLVLPGLRSRHEVFPEGKMASDLGGTWKGPEPMPEGTPPDSHLHDTPSGWTHSLGAYFPEFFEHRPGKWRCEA